MTYNGWKNRQTWNVSLWINNDEWLYRQASSFMNLPFKSNYQKRCSYVSFIKYISADDERTPDNIKWLGSRLDYKALNEMMNEFIEREA